MNGTLYLVATPIGNLSDITLRALDVLKTVDAIACEDTRHTLRLLNHFEIKKPLFSYYKQKEQEGAAEIIARLTRGENIALVSDAGMPCISDPGSVLVQKLRQCGLTYTVIPGASAVVAAVALSGVSGAFTFLGFLPEKRKERIKLLEEYKTLNSTLIFYAAPHDVNDYLQCFAEILGARTVHLAKEITKIHENVESGVLGTLVVENPRGEYVILIEPLPPVLKTYSGQEILAYLREKIKAGVPKKDAVRMAAEELGISKNIVYKCSLEL